MRYILFLFILFLVSVSNGQNVTFKLTGNIINKSNARILYIGTTTTSDSIEIQNDNSFSYIGNLKNPEMIFFFTDKSYVGNFWASNGDINIQLEDEILPSTKSNGKVSIKIKSIKGPYETIAFNNIRDSLGRIYLKYKSLPQNDDLNKKNEISGLVSEFVNKNPNSYMSPLIVRIYDLPTNDKIALLKIMSNNSDTTALNFLRTTIQRKILTEKGIKVENFTQKMVNGKPFDLYSVKNKFILLEFWSSSCAPCRANNPNWKKLYAEYHQRGLEIVGISLDSNLSDWKNAIKNDGLPWINVSDLLGFKNIVAQKFLIDFIPLNILLDETYSIVSFNISPSDLGDMINKSISK